MSWRYTKAEGWRETESLLLATDKDDWQEELHECGFLTEPAIKLGVSEKFGVEVYHKFKDGNFVAFKSGMTGKPLAIPEAKDVKDKFLGIVDVGGTCHEVFLPDLPDLVSFLSELEAICREVRLSSEGEKPE
jgi:hypothetical protein